MRKSVLFHQRTGKISLFPMNSSRVEKRCPSTVYLHGCGRSGTTGFNQQQTAWTRCSGRQRVGRALHRTLHSPHPTAHRTRRTARYRTVSQVIGNIAHVSQIYTLIPTRLQQDFCPCLSPPFAVGRSNLWSIVKKILLLAGRTTRRTFFPALPTVHILPSEPNRLNIKR